MFISVVEFEGHIECLHSFFKIFKHENSIKIAAYISKTLDIEIEELKPQFKNVEFFVKPSSQSIDFFLKKHLNNINKSDYVIFNTLQKQPHLYNLKAIKGTTIIRIHNINTFLNRKKNFKLSWNWYDLYKDFSYFVREYLWAQQVSHFKRLLQETDFIMLPDDSYTNYVIKNNLYPSKKIFPSVAMAVYDSAFAKQLTKNVLTLCITGTIDAKRKDYLLAFEAIKAALPDVLGKLRLILLGAPKGPYGQLVLNKFKSLKAKNFELVSFNKRIDQATFELYLMQTDVLLAPVAINTRYKFFSEIYGTTKISGSITDMIRYGKPLFLINQYQLSNEFAEVVFLFSNQNNLKKLILDVANEDFLLLQKQQKLVNFLKKLEAKKISGKTLENFKFYQNV